MSLVAKIARLVDAFDCGDLELAHEIALQLDAEFGSGERSHRCIECGRAFAYPGDLEAHLWAAHSWRWVA